MPSGTPTNVTLRRRKTNRATWLKNATRSLGMIGVDYLSDIAPGTMDIVTGVARSSKDVADLVRQANTSGVKVNTALQNNRYVKLANGAFKNILNDLKTGNFDNREREMNSMTGSSGMSFGDFDSESDEAVNVIDTSTTDQAIASLAEINTKNAEAMIKTTQAAMNANVATTAASMVQNQEIGNLISSKLDETNRNLAAIVEFNNSNFTKFIESATAYMENAGKALNAKEAGPTSNNKITINDVFSRSGGGIKFDVYKDYIKQQGKKYLENTQLGSLASMVDSFGDSLIANPIPIISKMALDSAIPEMIKTTVSDLDDTISGAFTTLVKRMTDEFRDSTESGITGVAKRFIGSTFGFKSDKKNDLNLGGKITKDAAVFDGFIYNQINQVIPKYLRESTAYLKVIAEQVSGRKNIAEKESEYFDASKGKYVKFNDYKKNFYENIRDRSANAILETSFGDAVRKGGFSPNVNTDEYDSMMRELFYQLSTKDTPDLRGNWKGTFADIIDNLKGSEKTKAYLQTAVNNTVEKQRGGASMAAGVLAGNAARKRFLGEIENNPGAYDIYNIAPDTQDFNKSYMQTMQALYGEDDATEADRRMKSHGSLMDKLTNINFLLERGINVRVTGKRAYTLEDGGIRPSRLGMEHVSSVRSDEPNVNEDSTPLDFDSLHRIEEEVDELQRDGTTEDDIDDDTLKGFVGKFRRKGLNIKRGIYDLINGNYKQGLNTIGDVVDSKGTARAYVKNKFLNDDTFFGKIRNKYDSIKNASVSDIKSGISSKLFGKTTPFTLSPEDAAMYGDNMPSTLHYRQEGGLLSWFRDGFNGLQESIFGVKVDPSDPIEVQRKKIKEQYSDKAKSFMNAASAKMPDEVKSSMKYLRDNAKAGAGGGIAGFLIGGPLGGAIGATLGYATKSKMFNSFMYGEIDENGNRTGGFKDKVVNAWHKFAQDHNLGTPDPNDPSKVKVSSAAKMSAAAATMGLMASFFTPVGPVGGAIGGAALGLAASSDKFKKFLFGEKDSNGRKMKEGLLGSVGNVIDTHWLRPAKNMIKDFIQDGKDAIQHKVLATIDIAFDPISQYLGNMVGSVIDGFQYRMSQITENVGNVVKNGASIIMDFLIRPAEKIGSLLMKTKFGGFLAKAGKTAAKVLNPMNIVRGAANFADKANRKASTKRYLAELKREKERNPDKAEEIDAKIQAIESGDPDAVKEAESMFYSNTYKTRMRENDEKYNEKTRNKKQARAERDKKDSIEKFISDMTDGRLKEATAENLEIARQNFEQRSSNWRRSYRGYKRKSIDFDDWSATIESMNPGSSENMNQEHINANVDNIDQTTTLINETITNIESKIEAILTSLDEERKTRYKYDNDYSRYKTAMDNGEEDFLTEDEFNRLGMADDDQYRKLNVLEASKKREQKKYHKSAKRSKKLKRRINRHKVIDNIEDTARDFIKNVTGYANGTEHSSEGIHVVGEEGPELVYMKEGMKVESGKRPIPVTITGMNQGALSRFIGFLEKHPLSTAITASKNILPVYSMGAFNSKTDRSEDIKKAVDSAGNITTAMVERDQFDDAENVGAKVAEDGGEKTKSIFENLKDFFTNEDGPMNIIIKGLKGLAGGLAVFAGLGAGAMGLAGLKKLFDILNGKDPDTSAVNDNTAQVDENGVPELNDDGTVKNMDASVEDANAGVGERFANYVAPNRTKIDVETGKAKTTHDVTNSTIDKTRALTLGISGAGKVATTLTKVGTTMLSESGGVAGAAINAGGTILNTFKVTGVKLINQIGDKIIGFLIKHGYDKAAEGVTNILSKILPSISDDVIVKNSSAISKFFGGLAEKANVIGFGIELASIGIGGINGATSAGNIFDVNMNDENISSYMKTLMVLVSGALGLFRGSSLGAFIDLISLLTQTDIIKFLGNKILQLLLSDDQEAALANAQKNFKLEYEQYSEQEYEAYVKNAEANNAEYLSYEDFKNSDQISTSYDEYNNDVNAGIITKGIRAVTNHFTSNRYNASNTDAKVYSSSSAFAQGDSSKNATATKTSSTASSYLTGGSGGISVPYYSQNDPRWRNAGYGSGSSGTMGTDGCGPTAFAMAASGAGRNVNPMQAASFMQKNGYRDNSGTNQKGMDAAARAVGLKTTDETNPSSSFVNNELSQGKPVVLLGRSGGYGDSAFTRNGHYVVATGTDNNGNVMINDPRGKRYSGKYKLNDVIGESTKAWAMGGKGSDTNGSATMTSGSSSGTGVTSNDVINIAKNELGYIEKASDKDLDSKTGNKGNNNYTKYERDVFGSNGNYWCASFVSWVIFQAANRNKIVANTVLRGSMSKSANALMTNFSNSQSLISSKSTPMPGDIIFFHNTGSNNHAGANHVGIVISVTETKINTIEGNTSSKKYDSNGGCVAEKSYTIGDSKIIGFGRPAYDNASSFNGLSATISSGDTSSDATVENGSSSASSIADIGSMVATWASKMATSSLNFLMGKGFTTGEEDAEEQPGSDGSTTGQNGSSGAYVDASSGSFTGNSNEEIIWNYYKSLGYSNAATAAIMANLKHESGLDPSRRQNGGGPAAGIAQWENANTNSGRFAQLSNYASSKGKSWNDLRTQLEFIHNELSGSQSSFFKKGSGLEKAGATPTTYEDWKTSNDVDMATRQFEGAFERAGKPAIETRIQYANDFYSKYAKTTGNGSSASTYLSGGSGGDDEYYDWIDQSPNVVGNAKFNSYTPTKPSSNKNKTREISGGRGESVVDLSAVLEYLQAIAENTGVSATKLDKLKSLTSLTNTNVNNTNLIGGSGSGSQTIDIPRGKSKNQMTAEKIAVGGY